MAVREEVIGCMEHGKVDPKHVYHLFGCGGGTMPFTQNFWQESHWEFLLFSGAYL